MIILCDNPALSALADLDWLENSGMIALTLVRVSSRNCEEKSKPAARPAPDSPINPTNGPALSGSSRAEETKSKNSGPPIRTLFWSARRIVAADRVAGGPVRCERGWRKRGQAKQTIITPRIPGRGDFLPASLGTADGEKGCFGWIHSDRRFDFKAAQSILMLAGKLATDVLPRLHGTVVLTEAVKKERLHHRAPRGLAGDFSLAWIKAAEMELSGDRIGHRLEAWTRSLSTCGSRPGKPAAIVVAGSWGPIPS